MGSRRSTTDERDTASSSSSCCATSIGAAWVSGTGGGICGPADDGGLLLAPTGVHKERVQPDEFFTVDPADGRVLRAPDGPDLRPSECNSIFCLAHRARGPWSVVHSHALSAVLAGDIAADADADHLAIRDLEMLKGIPDVDEHRRPPRAGHPQHAARAASWSASSRRPSRTRGSPTAHAVVVRDHGAYIWGDDVLDAKRHTEVYHFLFEATVARRDRRTGGPTMTDQARSAGQGPQST